LNSGVLSEHFFVMVAPDHSGHCRVFGRLRHSAGFKRFVSQRGKKRLFQKNFLPHMLKSAKNSGLIPA